MFDGRPEMFGAFLFWSAGACSRFCGVGVETDFAAKLDLGCAAYTVKRRQAAALQSDI
jgi:hypothetical protein